MNGPLFDSGRVGAEFPTVGVRYNDLRVQAECEVVQGKPLPTLWNSLKRPILVSIYSNFLQLSLSCICMHSGGFLNLLS